MAFYKLMFKALRSAGCRVYLTGSALIPGTKPTDLDYVVECPANWTRADLDAIVKPFGFKDADAREGYEKDPSQTVPEDHNSDLGIYTTEHKSDGIGEGNELVTLETLNLLPVQLLLFVRDSVAAGHWRKATANLKAYPGKYLTRESRVRMFREIRGQAV
jgi:hypothetical protein